MGDPDCGAPTALDVHNIRTLLLSVARVMSKFNQYVTEAHPSGGAIAIGEAVQARERLCLELRKLRTLESILPPEMETQFRTICSQAETLLAENPRDSWLTLGDGSEPSGGAVTHLRGGDQSLDGSVYDLNLASTDSQALVPSQGGRGAPEQPSIDVRLKDLKLNFALIESLPPVSSADQESESRPRIIEIHTMNDDAQTRRKMVVCEYNETNHLSAVNQPPMESAPTRSTQSPHMRDGNPEITDNHLTPQEGELKKDQYAEMLCELKAQMHQYAKMLCERVQAQMDQENERMKAELDDNLRRSVLEGVVPNTHVSNPARPTNVVTTEDKTCGAQRAPLSAQSSD